MKQIFLEYFQLLYLYNIDDIHNNPTELAFELIKTRSYNIYQTFIYRLEFKSSNGSQYTAKLHQNDNKTQIDRENTQWELHTLTSRFHKISPNKKLRERARVNVRGGTSENSFIHGFGAFFCFPCAQ